MSSKLTYNEAWELLPLYVLGTLEPDEMLAVDDVVQSHPELLARLYEIENALSQLAYAAPIEPLPLEAREQLLNRVRDDLHVSAASPALSPPPAALVAAAPARDTQLRRGWFVGRPGWAFATACVLLICAVLGTYSFQLLTNVARLEAEKQQLQLRLQQEEEYFVRAINADRSLVLASTQPGTNARGTFYLDGDQGEFIVSGLAQLPADKTYQAWLVTPGGTPTSVGLLSLQPDGSAILRVAVPAELRGFSIVDVSVENAGGSDVITKETIVLRGTLT